MLRPTPRAYSARLGSCFRSQVPVVLLSDAFGIPIRGFEPLLDEVDSRGLVLTSSLDKLFAHIHAKRSQEGEGSGHVRACQGLAEELSPLRLHLLAQTDEQEVDVGPHLPRHPRLYGLASLLRVCRGLQTRPPELVADSVHVRVHADALALPEGYVEKDDCHLGTHPGQLEDVLHVGGDTATVLVCNYACSLLNVLHLVVEKTHFANELA
mmetsp:Transcript_7149/g.20714  ORF Transcript_7149/g.20714 Transcript_7149/m.20714 type:complete len:210 (-) Transcript_7149:354-983(-)